MDWSDSRMSRTGTLHRSLGLVDAVAIGLGSMIGAGVFAAFAPAAAAAGSGLLIGLALAAIVAYCNATSSAQLAAQYPTSGGTYVYGRRQLGQWPGFLAGWCFVIGKTASCAAMALTFAAYAVPSVWERPVAGLAVAALVAVNYFGVTRTAGLTKIIVVVVLGVLAVVVIGGLASGHQDGSRLVNDTSPGNVYGILQSAGLLFFAFAGYARIATMGEEVRDPARTIPRAILIALFSALAGYAVIAFVALSTLGAGELAATTTPLADVAAAGGWDWTSVVVRIGAAAASLGALLALIAGIGRTSLAMARERDLPAWLSAVHPVYGVPHRAELVLGAVVVILVLTMDLRGAIGFSSFGVLLYYFVTNLSAYNQARAARLYPKPVQVLGAVLCVVLVATLPLSAIVGGAVLLAVGVLYRLLIV